jgi:DNA-directed RNA polymerase subunit RPC12/RpoP
MAQINLNCPHCGGGFSLDQDQPLQTYWACPYCGNRSLMQKIDGTIRLRGIIGSTGARTKDPSEPSTQEHHDEPLAAKHEKPVWPPPAEPKKPVRSLSDYIADVDEEHEDNGEEPGIRSPSLPEKGPAEWLFEKAETAACHHHLPAFNSYSRQALDKNPEDWRVYAWRAGLIEEADGFACATWASPIWYLYTPMQKRAILCQHLYAFNTSLQFTDEKNREDFIQKIAQQIVRQAVDHITERAILRCQRRWFFRKFKGRFHRADLRETLDFCDAVERIDEHVSPLGTDQLKRHIRVEASVQTKKLARRLTRFS